jgi:hypothetical protein
MSVDVDAGKGVLELDAGWQHVRGDGAQAALRHHQHETMRVDLRAVGLVVPPQQGVFQQLADRCLDLLSPVGDVCSNRRCSVALLPLLERIRCAGPRKDGGHLGRFEQADGNMIVRQKRE